MLQFTATKRAFLSLPNTSPIGNILDLDLKIEIKFTNLLMIALNSLAIIHRSNFDVLRPVKNNLLSFTKRIAVPPTATRPVARGTKCQSHMKSGLAIALIFEEIGLSGEGTRFRECP
ncbi:hypothetical protein ACMDCR_29575 [Labrys okinawensis]|uniref:hypothetical protein n=1 Tax=Labrys okinawensis TaxID=346911 RepID=UPI0039BD1A30